MPLREDVEDKLNDVLEDIKNLIKECKPCFKCKDDMCIFCRNMIKKYKIKTKLVSSQFFKYYEVL